MASKFEAKLDELTGIYLQSDEVEEISQGKTLRLLDEAQPVAEGIGKFMPKPGALGRLTDTLTRGYQQGGVAGIPGAMKQTLTGFGRPTKDSSSWAWDTDQPYRRQGTRYGSLDHRMPGGVQPSTTRSTQMPRWRQLSPEQQQQFGSRRNYIEWTRNQTQQQAGGPRIGGGPQVTPGHEPDQSRSQQSRDQSVLTNP